MNKTEIMNKMTRTFNRSLLQLKKHSPEILVISGIVGGVTSAVMACKATTKLDSVLEESKKTIDKIHNYVEETGYSEKYTEKDSKRDLTLTYTQGAIKVAKLYAPSVALGVVSITSILAGYNILHKRNMAIAAAYAAERSLFKDYRSRVVERFGEKMDKELRYNIKAEEFEENITDEKGKEKTVKKTVEVIDDPNQYSEFARIFDDGCRGWTKDPEYNFVILRNQQNYASDILKTRGHLFLNEVYDLLGFPRTKAGNVVGWIYDKDNPVGDNFVDFGIFDTNRRKARDFVNGYERTIVLDFNVDGNILDLI